MLFIDFYRLAGWLAGWLAGLAAWLAGWILGGWSNTFDAQERSAD